jgi:threonine/homoserine/homoserine lactone efflux protein
MVLLEVAGTLTDKMPVMETLLPLLGFVVAGTVTPGPNNFMVLASGANWGLARTIPHVLGISLGFPVIIIGAGFGIGIAFNVVPALEPILKYGAFAYLLWLAWKITRSGRPQGRYGADRPLTFLQAAAFQWVNPKAWALVFSGIALFARADGNKVVEIGLIALLFGLVCLPNCIAWGLFGKSIARFLADDHRRRVFNIAMAVLLVLSILPTLFEGG